MSMTTQTPDAVREDVYCLCCCRLEADHIRGQCPETSYFIPNVPAALDSRAGDAVRSAVEAGPQHPRWNEALRAHDATTHLVGCHGTVSDSRNGWQPCSCYRNIRAMLNFAATPAPAVDAVPADPKADPCTRS